ncbi:MAG: class I lanthipeptide [Spirosomataceae bacterium]
MKKQIKKLAFSTEKIMSLTKTQLQNAQGGGPGIRPALGLRPSVDYTEGTRCCGSITGE